MKVREDFLTMLMDFLDAFLTDPIIQPFFLFIGVESIVGECLKIRALQVLKEQDKFESLVLDVLEVASR